MAPFMDIGKILIVIGIVILILGGLLVGLGKIPGLGRLPGDIIIQRENFTFYFPVATMIVLSILLSLILSIVFRR